ncbi:hypothetical protein WR25_08230 isoform C [Diploscapter pachys]|uniref:Uncharacterized protein n=1 Tax=Diploscapter pachys TaxID=2018661 RepID=A0A2A2LHD3_9BILA|nr:hypothetical protein WR25_08230 isoform B [Diploscapter pachys]PAV85612.1 hypothetical protein WR25_08230 isoform C [Diploscapter pachys]
MQKNAKFDTIWWGESQSASAFKIWKAKRKETVKKKLKAAPKKEKKVTVAEKKEKDTVVEKRDTVDEKDDKDKVAKDKPKSEPSKIKKLFLGRKAKPIVVREASTETSESFSQESEQERAARTIGIKMREKVKNEKRIIEKLPIAKCNLAQDLKKPGDKPQNTVKTIRQKTKDIAKTRLKCKASSLESIFLDEAYRRRPVAQKAQVIVDAPIQDVNISKVRLRVKTFRHSLPSIIESTGTPVNEKNTASAPQIPEVRTRKIYEDQMKRSMSRESTTKASELLDEMRFTEPALEWKRDNDDENQNDGHLILPDQSILEEYVKRKRGRLDRHLRSSRSASICSSKGGYESSNGGCESPANSTISELHAPPSVRIQTSPASQRGVPLITTPTRTECSTPGSSQGAMLDVSSFNNFNSTPQGFKLNPPAKIQIAKPIAFDAPKSPFEERLQQQANIIRKTSVCSSISDNEGNDQSRSEGMSTLSSAFTAAVSHPRHEQRYAAHIPVNRNNSLEASSHTSGQPQSGRQSSTSVDSGHSGVLDTASKQLEAVIDEARTRHHHQRSKFKDAIDYLDQIFEDLKKECDVEIFALLKSDKADHIRAAAQEANRLFRPQPSTSNSLPNRAQRHRPVQPPSPVELIIPVVKTSGATVAANSPPIEPSVAETIVLPKKTDKLDFTRRWLHDDLSSLAHQPPANIAPDVSIYQDVDEHSLGSCSAEVAAICSNKRDRPQKKSTNQQQNGTSKSGKQPQVKTNGTRQKPQQQQQQQSQQQSGPVRPQPFRPQPVYALPNGNQNNNGVSRFPAELEPPQPLARVASFDNGHHSGNNSARAISQEPYQTLGSARSDEPGCRPSPSAFHNVPSSSSFSSRGGIRGSLRSLPDAGLLVRQKQPEEMKDPVLAIDQLVAELELNTEQMSVSDKRRSFPTSFVRIQNDYEQPVKQRAELRQVISRLKICIFTPTSTVARNKSRRKNVLKILFES